MGKGIGGLAARLAGSVLLGPAGGAAASKLAGNWIDRGNPLQFNTSNSQIGPVQRESIAIPGVSQNMGFPGGYSPLPTNFGSLNPQLGAVNALSGGEYAQGLANNAGNWTQQSGQPFMPGYVAPNTVPRNSMGQGGSYAGKGGMTGMGGDGALGFLAGRMPPKDTSMFNNFKRVF